MTTPQTTGVIGAGTMGNGTAESFVFMTSRSGPLRFYTYT